MAEFWAEWGRCAYLIAAVWAFFEGETFVLAASALGRLTGAVDPWVLMVCVWLGSYAGDQTWFFLGRRYGAKALKRFPAAESKVAGATALLQRYGTFFVLGFRFVYGIRNVASAACGIAGMDPARFAVLNFIAAGLWAASFVAAGWYVASIIPPEDIGYAIGGVGLLVLTIFVVRYYRKRQRRRASLSPVL